mmetsp:Transcript_22364/g.24944  ORF Transcript_22364/g.24944 Transcript_22364/m.24944 type:complete len:214 (+) Transcript_22364:103-744(+)
MLRSITLLLVLVTITYAVGDHSRSCSYLPDVSDIYYQSIAHAIHSIDDVALNIFYPEGTPEAALSIPTVDLFNAGKVNHHVRSMKLGNTFATRSLNVIDGIFNNFERVPGNWSAAVRIVHYFHMRDLWYKVKDAMTVTPVPDAKTCECLLDADHNGVVEFMLSYTGYSHGPDTHSLPPLTDGKSWQLWKESLTVFYTDEALRDAALYMMCLSK